MEGALKHDKDVGGMVLRRLSLKPLKAPKSLAAMGMESQQGGERVGEGASEMERESKESRREHQESSHPSSVTQEARNMAEQLIAKMDIMDNTPNPLS